MVDFYRTLSDLAGIDPTTVEKGVEGDSLAAVVRDPSIGGKLYAFSQTQRVSIPTLKRTGTPAKPKEDNQFKALPAAADGFFDPSCWSYGSGLEWMGYTVRSQGWRLTQWHRWNGNALCPLVANQSLSELYDHRADTSIFDLDVAEYENVAAANANVVAKLAAVLDRKIELCE